MIDPKPRTTSDHIAAYRQQIAVRQNSGPEESVEPEADLFADMVPDIKRQRKVFVGEEVAVMEVEPEMTIRPEVAVMEPEVAVTEPEITMTMTTTMAALDGKRNQN